MRIESNTNSYCNSNSQVDVGKKEATPLVVKKSNQHLKEAVNNVPNDVLAKPQVDEHQVIEAIEKANKQIKCYDRKLEFSIHEKTKQIMVKVINTEDDSIIREIPSEKILDMVAKLWEMAGVFVDEKR